MFGWLKRFFGSKGEQTLPHPNQPTETGRAFPRGGPIRYQPLLTTGRLVGSAALGEKHTVLLFDSLKSAGRMQYTFLLVVIDQSAGHPVLFVAAEVNELADVLGGGSHALGVFDTQGHANLGFSNDWGDATKFFPKAIAVAAPQFGVDPAQVRVEPVGG